jgi:RNA polymerase sigma factor (sigma-70 family)
MQDAFTPDDATVLKILLDLGTERQLDLDDATFADYARDIGQHLGHEPITPAQLQARCRIYLANRDTVDALRDDHHHLHHQAWENLHGYVQRVIWKQIDRSLPNAADIVDEAAINALVAIRQSLSNYSYKAKITTWAHTLIINKFRNYLRDQHILKPKLDIVDTDVTEVPIAIRSADHPVHQAEGAALASLVQRILQDQPELYQQVFWLSFEGHKLAEIGKQVGRSPSRVYEILRQLRTVIQSDPRFREWLSDPSSSDTSHDADESDR